MFFEITVYRSRRLRPRYRREDVHYRRAGDCVWCFSVRCVWDCLLDIDLVLKAEDGENPSSLFRTIEKIYTSWYNIK